MAQNSKNQLLVQIHDLIEDTFNLEEFRDLCFRLGVKYDNLRGDNLSARIRDLVETMYRRRRLGDLLNFCARLRPHVEWPDQSDPVGLDAAPTSLATPERNPRQIFLSHARQDADFAHQLAADLHRHEWHVWIAPDSIRPGEGWVDAINRGLAESGIFLLALTPDAVNSKWVHSETNVAIGLQHENLLRFMPLDVKQAAAPPLWKAYQWVSFQSDYKAGLEELLQVLQPEKMQQLDGLYRQLLAVNGRQDWGQVQKLGAEINVLYPDYRETETIMTLAEREEAREQRQQAEASARKQQEEDRAQRRQTEAAQLYGRLRAAVDAADWTAALTLAEQVEALVPNYRDVKQLKNRARRGQRQNWRDAIIQSLRRIPAWGWGGGIIAIAFALFWVFQLAGGGGNGSPTATPTPTLPAVSQITPEIPIAAETLESTNTLTMEPINTVIPSPVHTVTPEPTNTPTMMPTPALGIGSTRIRPTDEAVMVYVPEGSFMMGSDDGGSDEQPIHAVYLDSYWIDQTEVTNSMYDLCVKAGVCERPDVLVSYTRDNYYSNLDYADFPVIYVNWNHAKTYCEWAGGRLPTEAEWEKAARWDEEDQEARTYPWGEIVDCNYANARYYSDDMCRGDTTAVGSYPNGASPYGALDMTGNVWEWVADWYDGNYYQSSPVQNPQGPDNGYVKVLRGGSMFEGAIVRAASRDSNDILWRYFYIGFRCAQE